MSGLFSWVFKKEKKVKDTSLADRSQVYIESLDSTTESYSDSSEEWSEGDDWTEEWTKTIGEMKCNDNNILNPNSIPYQTEGFTMNIVYSETEPEKESKKGTEPEKETEIPEAPAAPTNESLCHYYRVPTPPPAPLPSREYLNNVQKNIDDIRISIDNMLSEAVENFNSKCDESAQSQKSIYDDFSTYFDNKYPNGYSEGPCYENSYETSYENSYETSYESIEEDENDQIDEMVDEEEMKNEISNSPEVINWDNIIGEAQKVEPNMFTPLLCNQFEHNQEENEKEEPVGKLDMWKNYWKTKEDEEKLVATLPYDDNNNDNNNNNIWDIEKGNIFGSNDNSNNNYNNNLFNDSSHLNGVWHGLDLKNEECTIVTNGNQTSSTIFEGLNIYSSCCNNDRPEKKLKLSQNESSEGNIGHLELYIGPMFSGKSTAVIRKITEMADVGFKVLYINHVKDERMTEAQDNIITTHNSQYKGLSYKVSAVKTSLLSSIDVDYYDYIAIDEGQFFEDLYKAVTYWVNSLGKTVYIASLDGDFSKNKFGQVTDLIPDADKVKKLKAYCQLCQEKYNILRHAPFTGRIVQNTSQILVGSTDVYKAMCRKCHSKYL